LPAIHESTPFFVQHVVSSGLRNGTKAVVRHEALNRLIMLLEDNQVCRAGSDVRLYGSQVAEMVMGGKNRRAVP
jgi:hypothetical protein